MKAKKTVIKNIWMLTREYGELAGAGGVKDVTAQLSRALARWSGRRVSVVLPLYGFIEPDVHGFTPLADPLAPNKELEFQVDMNYVESERREAVRVWSGVQEKVRVYLLQSPRFDEKGDVYTYGAADERDDPWKRQGKGHFDYFAMNLLLQKGALQLMLLLHERPDVIHCHDGHTAVLPAMIHETPWLKSYFRTTGCLVTVHNAGTGYHQEVADLPFSHAMTGLPLQVIMKSRLQGNFDPFIAASHYAVMNTVSENYARELQQTIDDEMTGWLGHHLLDIGVKLEGVTNGIEPEDFDPRRGVELGLGFSYDPLDDDSMEGKKKCKDLFIQELSTQNSIEGVVQYGWLDKGRDSPLFSFIGRLSEQKGIDILLAALPLLLQEEIDFQLVILGSGDADIEHELIGITENPKSHGSLCYLNGYSPSLANRVYGAGDFFLMPSRYEPCGLTDFIAQLFGNLPIVHGVGGLVKVVDEVSGFSYEDNSAATVVATIKRAMSVYRDSQTMRSMQKEAVLRIEKNYTWKVVMQHYLELYKKSLPE